MISDKKRKKMAKIVGIITIFILVLGMISPFLGTILYR
jgi:hypothetical protein